MLNPTKVDFWYSESDFRLSNMELLTLARLLVKHNSYPGCFRHISEGSEHLESKISCYFIKSGLNGIPDSLEIG
ncbi:hypothetical protein LCGC14_1053460 [marine sediment metagenome]|uniref:Uncharacterized protein n=1 Tax=marine sediment metagenome TaxID=412755 RepID=A0A0F9QU64_9ZZZZ